MVKQQKIIKKTAVKSKLLCYNKRVQNLCLCCLERIGNGKNKTTGQNHSFILQAEP